MHHRLANSGGEWTVESSAEYDGEFDWVAHLRYYLILYVNVGFDKWKLVFSRTARDPLVRRPTADQRRIIGAINADHAPCRLYANGHDR